MKIKYKIVDSKDGSLNPIHIYVYYDHQWTMIDEVFVDPFAAYPNVEEAKRRIDKLIESFSGEEDSNAIYGEM